MTINNPYPTKPYPNPLAELLGLCHRHEVDVMLSAQRLDQLLVVGAVAVLCQDAQLGLAPLNRAGGLVQPTGKAVMGKGCLQHALWWTKMLLWFCRPVIKTKITMMRAKTYRDCGVEVQGLIGCSDLRDGSSLSVQGMRCSKNTVKCKQYTV